MFTMMFYYLNPDTKSLQELWDLIIETTDVGSKKKEARIIFFFKSVFSYIIFPTILIRLLNI